MPDDLKARLDRAFAEGKSLILSPSDVCALTLSREEHNAVVNLNTELLTALERIADECNYGEDGGWIAESYPDEIARLALPKRSGK